MAAKGVVQGEGREGALERGRVPDLHKASDGEGDPAAVGRKAAVGSFLLQVEVRDHHSFEDVDEEEVSLVIDSDEKRAVR